MSARVSTVALTGLTPTAPAAKAVTSNRVPEQETFGTALQQAQKPSGASKSASPTATSQKPAARPTQDTKQSTTGQRSSATPRRTAKAGPHHDTANETATDPTALAEQAAAFGTPPAAPTAARSAPLPDETAAAATETPATPVAAPAQPLSPVPSAAPAPAEDVAAPALVTPAVVAATATSDPAASPSLTEPAQASDALPNATPATSAAPAPGADLLDGQVRRATGSTVAATVTVSSAATRPETASIAELPAATVLDHRAASAGQPATDPSVGQGTVAQPPASAAQLAATPQPDPAQQPTVGQQVAESAPPAAKPDAHPHAQDQQVQATTTQPQPLAASTDRREAGDDQPTGDAPSQERPSSQPRAHDTTTNTVGQPSAYAVQQRTAVAAQVAPPTAASTPVHTEVPATQALPAGTLQQVHGDEHSVRVQLHTDALGRLTADLHTRPGQMAVQLTVPDDAGRALMAQRMDALRDSLGQSGTAVHLSLTAQDNQPSSQQSQGFSTSQGQQGNTREDRALAARSVPQPHDAVTPRATDGSSALPAPAGSTRLVDVRA